MQAEAMRNAKQVILDVSKDFEKMTGRKYGLFEEYKLDDAEVAIVCMNSTAGTTKFVVDKLREKGIKAGLLKIRVFRPFPVDEVANALSHLKAIAILDKADSLNAAGGALFEDVTSAMSVSYTHLIYLINSIASSLFLQASKWKVIILGSTEIKSSIADFISFTIK